MDYSAPSLDPLPIDDGGMGFGENLDGEVYGLSNLCQSCNWRIAACVKKIGQQQWKPNASVCFVNDREKSNEEEEDIEEEDIEYEPINDYDTGLEGYEDDDDDFVGPGQEGISLWDGLGEGFLREVSQLVLRLQTIKAIVNSRSFKSPKSDEPRRVQVLYLYCLTRFESEGSSKGIVY